jgi:ketosteroid isomerase-like protein
MGQTDEARVRHIWRTFIDGGISAALPLLAEDFRWRPFAGDPLLVVGRENARRFMDELAAEGQRLRPSVATVESHDGRVLVHGRLRLEAPGRIADDDVWWDCRLRDGLLSHALAHHARP